MAGEQQQFQIDANQMMEYRLRAADINIITASLAEQPYKMVANILQAIQTQTMMNVAKLQSEAKALEDQLAADLKRPAKLTDAPEPPARDTKETHDFQPQAHPEADELEAMRQRHLAAHASGSSAVNRTENGLEPI